MLAPGVYNVPSLHLLKVHMALCSILGSQICCFHLWLQVSAATCASSLGSMDAVVAGFCCYLCHHPRSLRPSPWRPPAPIFESPLLQVGTGPCSFTCATLCCMANTSALWRREICLIGAALLAAGLGNLSFLELSSWMMQLKVWHPRGLSLLRVVTHIRSNTQPLLVMMHRLYMH